MYKYSTFLIAVLFLACTPTKQITAPVDPFQKTVGKLSLQDGFFDYWWDEDKGKIWLGVDQLDQDFLYVNYLSNGLGSNDIGLDRGQIGNDRLVQWKKVGNKLLLIQPNLEFRSSSSNADEVNSIEEAFARSVLWGFDIAAKKNGKLLVDLTPFLLRDAHGVTETLSNKKQGNYKVDKSRCGIIKEQCFAFPKNVEFEGLVTFTGNKSGNYLRSVVPTNGVFSLQMHHSFIALPEDPLPARVFDPRAGYFPLSYYDYSSPIDQPIQKRIIQRHRLVKKNPNAEISEAVEPIVYYLDRGTPEPVRSNLLAGARWWNKAFEAAGFQNAFQVQMLPEDAHPLDIRYNVIQWVHRSTRGWSYGSSVVDPRSGEILKGHVSLGSLRVRQDFLIAQGLVQAYKDGDNPDPRLLDMALERLRQLSAHEVGHTLGLAHNFAASVDGRTSVMDYPYPYLTMNEEGIVNFEITYEDGSVRDWDKQAIKYGYGQWADESAGLAGVLAENASLGLQFISDADARPANGMHISAHLWDNGSEPVYELYRILKLRKKAMDQFGLDNIPNGTPLASLEEVLAPLYLAHRYQVEAVSKLIGGMQYSYRVKGEKKALPTRVPPAQQDTAIDAMLRVITPTELRIPDLVLELIAPKPTGYRRSRESFKSKTGPAFDPLTAAQGIVDHTLYFLLHPHRMNRLHQQAAVDDRIFGPAELLSRAKKILFTGMDTQKGLDAELQQLVAARYIEQLFQLFKSTEIHPQVAATVFAHLQGLSSSLKNASTYQQYLSYSITQFLKDPTVHPTTPSPKMPDGSPIGSDVCRHFFDLHKK